MHPSARPPLHVRTLRRLPPPQAAAVSELPHATSPLSPLAGERQATWRRLNPDVPSDIEQTQMLVGMLERRRARPGFGGVGHKALHGTAPRPAKGVRGWGEYYRTVQRELHESVAQEEYAGRLRREAAFWDSMRFRFADPVEMEFVAGEGARLREMGEAYVRKGEEIKAQAQGCKHKVCDVWGAADRPF